MIKWEIKQVESALSKLLFLHCNNFSKSAFMSSLFDCGVLTLNLYDTDKA